MRFDAPHPWDVSPKEVITIQAQLSRQVIETDQIGSVRKVAGVDVGFEERGTVTRAARD